MSYLLSSALDSKRTVLAAMETIANEKGLLSGIFLANGARKERYKTTKLEQKIKKEGRIKSNVTTAAISGFYTSTAADLIIGDTTNFLVWDILEFRTIDNKLKGNLTLWVDSITNGTTLSVKKVGWTDIAIDITDNVILKINANEEASSDKTRPIYLPTTAYNLSTIIREAREVSGTAMVVNNYDVKSAEWEARRQVLDGFARQLNALCTSSVRTTVVLGWTSRKVIGGMQFFSDNAFDADGEVTWPATGNVKDGGGVDVTQDMVNDGFQYVIENGGRLNSALVAPAQARKISGFDEGKIVINAEALATASTRGTGAVQILKSPISINGNIIDKIYVDTSVAKDEIRLFDRSKGYLLPMDKRSYIESKSTILTTDNAVDGVKVGGLGEYSFLFENADIYTYTISNLKID